MKYLLDIYDEPSMVQGNKGTAMNKIDKVPVFRNRQKQTTNKKVSPWCSSTG